MRCPRGWTRRRTRGRWPTVRHQRDHFAETPALVIPCYRWPALKPEAAGPKESATALGAAASLRPARRQKRILSLTEASSVCPGAQNLLLAARRLGLAADTTSWRLMLERARGEGGAGDPEGREDLRGDPGGVARGRFGPVRRRPWGA
ncbi:hypothetical protein Sdia_38790 [Streptomyces diastaticus subsp. diastaticus]|uniref:Uncharacterized protein n=1 Tax=Streptomyces diastaticus subsp. diastaticus TaxID=68040 RepID=A0ABQ1CRZ5_STRDI|nr:hypothetical protein Sdia_38790 [Streptomyces diastaticus subsp. diastaticus]GGU24993.1 hypothetical protein GCM10015534_29530 [Streptomyces diastaticus subsp. diastaticus]